MTPLMIAAGLGHSGIVRALLNKGANVSIADRCGWTALHLSARRGRPAVTKLLVKAGADLERESEKGITPLHVAAGKGYSEVLSVLIDAGANPNCQGVRGVTPLCVAVKRGHVDAIKVLLRARANPLLAYTNLLGCTYVPLDAAARNGHLEIARELMQQNGIEGCGGASGGVRALQTAAENQHVAMMDRLC